MAACQTGAKQSSNEPQECRMSKRARKKRDRKKSKASHGKRPNT
jgi:hypothetical protein